VGDLEIDNGIAKRGLLVRHLVMPNNLAGTREIVNFLAKDISVNTYINIMPQYRPCGDVANNPDLSRAITNEEFENAINCAKEAGLYRLD